MCWGQFLEGLLRVLGLFANLSHLKLVNLHSFRQDLACENSPGAPGARYGEGDGGVGGGPGSERSKCRGRPRLGGVLSRAGGPGKREASGRGWKGQCLVWCPSAVGSLMGESPSCARWMWVLAARAPRAPAVPLAGSWAYSGS